MSMQLSEHFTLQELTFSDTAARHGIDNTADAATRRNLELLSVSVLEPIRERCGVLRINSGYRCAEVNRIVGGSRTSAHLSGRAADFIPLRPSIGLLRAYEIIQRSNVDYDQLIFEYGRWIHVGISESAKGSRREDLMIFRPGSYEAFDARAVLGN